MDRIILALATGSLSLNKKKKEQERVIQILLYLSAFFYCYLLSHCSFWPSFFINGLLVVVAICIAGMAEKIINIADANIILIDSFIGISIAFLAIPCVDNHFFLLLYFIVGSTLFILCNRVKPFPANWVKMHLNGGFAVVLDDIIVGGYVLLFLQVSWLLFSVVINL